MGQTKFDATDDEIHIALGWWRKMHDLGLDEMLAQARREGAEAMRERIIALAAGFNAATCATYFLDQIRSLEVE
jgi:hypothetical protein